MKLPRMNRWPGDNSVLVMDNCAIHKSEALRVVVEGTGVFYITTTSSLPNEGCQLVFLPGYSPDLNPIEESFSACTRSVLFCKLLTRIIVISEGISAQELEGNSRV